MSPTQPNRRRIRLASQVYEQPGTVALLTICTTGRRRLFDDSGNADLILGEISRLHGENARVLGFCIMPDHVHLLVLNLVGSHLGFMRSLKGRSTAFFREKGVSAVWQRSFHDHILRRNEDISGALRYLLENPLRAGLVDSWTEYRWCGSYQWPDIDTSFFEVASSDVLWDRIEGLNPLSEAERGRG